MSDNIGFWIFLGMLAMAAAYIWRGSPSIIIHEAYFGDDDDDEGEPSPVNYQTDEIDR